MIKKKFAPFLICCILLFSILACSLSFQPESGEANPTETAPGETPVSGAVTPLPTQTSPPPAASATLAVSATIPALPTQAATDSLPPTATLLITITALPTSSFSGVAPGYHMVKIHNRYPFTLYVYMDGLYLMEIPAMKYMTYNGVKEGLRTFTFTKRHKRQPVSILTERLIEVSGFTEIWVSP